MKNEDYYWLISKMIVYIIFSIVWTVLSVYAAVIIAATVYATFNDMTFWAIVMAVMTVSLYIVRGIVVDRVFLRVFTPAEQLVILTSGKDKK